MASARAVGRSFEDHSGAPNSTGWPSATRMRFTLPARGAAIWFIVFIASMMRSVWPSAHLVADLDERRRAGLGLQVDGADHRRGHDAGIVGRVRRRDGSRSGARRRGGGCGSAWIGAGAGAAGICRATRTARVSSSPNSRFTSISVRSFSRSNSARALMNSMSCSWGRLLMVVPCCLADSAARPLPAGCLVIGGSGLGWKAESGTAPLAQLGAHSVDKARFPGNSAPRSRRGLPHSTARACPSRPSICARGM